MPHLSRTDLDSFAHRLQERRRVLIAEIRKQMEEGDDEHSVTLRAQFDGLDPHDDRAVSDWVRDVGVAQVVRDTRELDAVEMALRRVAAGSYGECTDCGEAIPRARLEANLGASRCLPCQQKFEARSGSVPSAL
jgi:RNA polymerase-binding transcription factor DksA